MGLFCLNNEKQKTAEGLLESARNNLEILEDLVKAFDGVTDKNGNGFPDYLLHIAIMHLDRAKEVFADPEGQLRKLPDNKAF